MLEKKITELISKLLPFHIVRYVYNRVMLQWTVKTDGPEVK